MRAPRAGQRSMPMRFEQQSLRFLAMTSHSIRIHTYVVETKFRIRFTIPCRPGRDAVLPPAVASAAPLFLLVRACCRLVIRLFPIALASLHAAPHRFEARILFPNDSIILWLATAPPAASPSATTLVPALVFSLIFTSGRPRLLRCSAARPRGVASPLAGRRQCPALRA